MAAKPIGMILQELADLDVFFYALPFLLIFALVFAVLQKVNLTGKNNKGVDAVISIAAGLLALQYDSVPLFFQIIFPKLGIALSVILAAIVLVGMFIDFREFKAPAMIFASLGGIAFIIILLSSFQDYSWWTGYFWQDNMSAIIAGIIMIVFIGVVIGGSGKQNSNNTKDFFTPIRTQSSPGGQ